MWNEFAKMVMKQVKLVDGAIEEGGYLKVMKGVIGWLMYYWEMLFEDMVSAKIGGPELEGETGREGVEVKISNFGCSEGLDMSYEKLFGEVKRVTWRVEGVKKKSAEGKMQESIAVKGFVQQGEGTREEATDISREQVQPSPPAPPAQSSTTSKHGIQVTGEAAGSSDRPKLTESPFPKEQIAASHHVAKDEKRESATSVPQDSREAPAEPADTEEPQFYEVPEQWPDTHSEGSDDIPPQNERATVIPGLAHSISGAEFLNQKNDSTENIHNPGNRFSEVIVDEVSSETEDHEITGETNGKK